MKRVIILCVIIGLMGLALPLANLFKKRTAPQVEQDVFQKHPEFVEIADLVKL